jgi:hypothetical protein
VRCRREPVSGKAEAAHLTQLGEGLVAAIERDFSTAELTNAGGVHAMLTAAEIERLARLQLRQSVDLRNELELTLMGDETTVIERDARKAAVLRSVRGQA